MPSELEKLVRGVSKASPDELKKLAELLLEKARVAEAKEVMSTLRETLDHKIGQLGQDPSKMIDFTRYVSNYGHTRTRTRKPGRKAESDHEHIRQRIETALHRFYDRLPTSKRTDISAQDMIHQVPEIKEIVPGNIISLARYLMTIRKSGAIKYDRKSQTYTITSPLIYDKVAKAADVVHKRQNTVTIYDLQKEGVVGNPHAMARYLLRWGKSHNMDSENLKVGRRQHCSVYFKGKRPPMTPLEKVKATVGSKKVVRHNYLKQETNLSDRSIYTLMGGSMGFESRGSSQRREYYRPK